MPSFTEYLRRFIAAYFLWQGSTVKWLGLASSLATVTGILGVVGWVAGVQPGRSLWLVMALPLGFFVAGFSVWSKDQDQLRLLKLRLGAIEETRPRIMVEWAGEDEHPTTWVGSHENLKPFFSHIRFVNHPFEPMEASIAEGVAARLELLDSEGQVVLRWVGRWADNPQPAAIPQDARELKRITIAPDGLLVSLDVLQRVTGLSTSTFFAYNDEARLKGEHGMLTEMHIRPGNYALKVLLRGTRLPAQEFSFALDLSDPTHPARFTQLSGLSVPSPA